MKSSALAAAASALLLLTGCSSTESGSASGSGKGRSGAPTSSAASTDGRSSSSASSARHLLGEDACSLLTKSQAASLLGVAKAYSDSKPYDVVQALKNADTQYGTHKSAGYQGHASICGFATTAGALWASDPQNSTFVSVTLIIDTGGKDSYTLFGYGAGKANDVSGTLGVESEQNEVNHFVAARLTKQAWIIVNGKTAGSHDDDLVLQATKRIVDNTGGGR